MARGSARRIISTCSTLRILTIISSLLITSSWSSVNTETPLQSRFNDESYPRLDSLQVTNSTYHHLHDDSRNRLLLVEAQGRRMYPRMAVRTTRSPKVCEGEEDVTWTPPVNVLDVNFVGTTALFAVDLVSRGGDYRGPVYFCLPRTRVGDELVHGDQLGGGWQHQGAGVVLQLGEEGLSEARQRDEYPSPPRHHLRRHASDDPSSAAMTSGGVIAPSPDLPTPPRVIGIRVEPVSRDSYFSDDGIPVLLVDYLYQLVIFGQHFTPTMLVTFTKHAASYGGACQYPVTQEYQVLSYLRESAVVLQIKLPSSESHENFYVCLKEPEPPDSASPSTAHNTTTQLTASQAIPFVHQGSDTWCSIRSVQKLVPLWAGILIIATCLCFSALFSGLNLGLMSLDRTELRILCNTGTAQERMYAKMIQPVRNHGNYLLCSILLGNVLVNSTFTILLDDLTSGVIAVVFSTLLIVLFGEITPQAVCSRHGLMIGARTIVMTKLVMGVTFPLSYPISKLLDLLLGEEIGNVYNRERLKELVKVTTGENDLDRDEVNIISGALELRRKCVSDVMTHIEDSFLLDYDAILDFETVSEIMKSGYSRIPVYEGHRNNIVTTLYIKDLAFVDPDDNTPLKTLCQFYQNPCNFVFEDVTLDVMFKDFKGGNKGHMAFVNRVNSEGEGDPFYETIGLVTLEDVIEELIQAEIMDETDVFTDNRSKRRRNADRTKQDFTVFAERRNENNRIRISPQLTLAAFQYLSTSVDQFKPHNISETILRRLLKQDIINHIKKNRDWRNDPVNVIYQQHKPADFFVLILEGRVEVTVGNENLMFESGPFTYFGTQALQQNIGLMNETMAAARYYACVAPYHHILAPIPEEAPVAADPNCILRIKYPRTQLGGPRQHPKYTTVIHHCPVSPDQSQSNQSYQQQFPLQPPLQATSATAQQQLPTPTSTTTTITPATIQASASMTSSVTATAAAAAMTPGTGSLVAAAQTQQVGGGGGGAVMGSAQMPTSASQQVAAGAAQVPPSAMGSLQSLNMDSMLKCTFQPDYTVRATTEVLYLKVQRSLYLAAKRASLMEQSRRDQDASGGGVGGGAGGADDGGGSDQFDDEMEKFFNDDSDDIVLHFQMTERQRQQKLLHSLEEDGSIGKASPILHHKHTHINNNNNQHQQSNHPEAGYGQMDPPPVVKNTTVAFVEPLTNHQQHPPTSLHRKSYPSIHPPTSTAAPIPILHSSKPPPQQQQQQGSVGGGSGAVVPPANGSAVTVGGGRAPLVSMDGGPDDDLMASSQEETSLLPKGAATGAITGSGS